MPCPARVCDHRAMVDVVLLDFYGTVVHEDDVVIDQICKTISRSAEVHATPREIGSYWWATFSDGFKSSYGDGFQTQRRIELASLARTIENFEADCSAEELSGPLFDYWERPPIFDDAIPFLDGIGVPVIVVSNIDRFDIDTAIAHHGLSFDHVITSEDVRSYKPRPELFLAGLEAAGCPPDRALHVGDSLTSDVAGALRLGLPVAWVNRKGKPPPSLDAPNYEVANLMEVRPLIDADR